MSKSPKFIWKKTRTACKVKTVTLCQQKTVSGTTIAYICINSNLNCDLNRNTWKYTEMHRNVWNFHKVGLKKFNFKKMKIILSQFCCTWLLWNAFFEKKLFYFSWLLFVGYLLLKVVQTSKRASTNVHQDRTLLKV